MMMMMVMMMMINIQNTRIAEGQVPQGDHRRRQLAGSCAQEYNMI
jgi:hypothetical protein